MAKPSKLKKKKGPQPDPPWKILWPADRGATQGDKDRDTLHAAVGFALTRWEELEEELSQLFCALVQAQWGTAAVRAYGSVSNFHNRADMLDAASEAFFQDALRFRKKIAGLNDVFILSVEKDYREFIKHCRNFSARRNDIAHGTSEFNPVSGYFLTPPFYNSKKITFDQPLGSYSYTSVEMGVYADHFGRLNLWCRQVRSAVEDIAKKTS